MRFTPLILLFPVSVFFLGWSGHGFGGFFFILWITSILTSLGWGIFISRQSRFWGWLCVAVGLIMLFLLLMPVLAIDRSKQ